MSDRTLRQLYLPAFRAAVDAGVKTAMSAYTGTVGREADSSTHPPTHPPTHPLQSIYTEVAGRPMVANKLYTIDLLRHELGWEGLLKPDYHEMANLFEWHMLTNTSKVKRMSPPTHPPIHPPTHHTNLHTGRLPSRLALHKHRSTHPPTHPPTHSTNLHI